MKKMIQMLFICVVIVIMVLSFCTAAFAASIGHMDDDIVNPLATRYGSTYRKKSSASEKAVFNVEKYNNSTPGYVKDQNNVTRSIWWRVDYKTSSGGTGRAMGERWVKSGVRDTCTMTTNSTSNTYRLVMYNSFANYTLKIKGSWTPG